MKKRLFWLAIGLLVMVSAVAIFNHQEVSAAKNEVAKPAKITAMFDIVLSKDAGQDQFCEEFKKQTGIELKINQPPHNQYPEKMLIAFASNDIPDIVEISPDYPTHYLQLADQKAIIPLNTMIAKSKVLNKINKVYNNSFKLSNGQICAYPLNQGGGCITYLRKDWLDAVGMQLPTTYNDLYAVMKAFNDKDPDKNGKADTVAYTFSMSPLAEIYLEDFMQGASLDFIKKGKWIDGFAQKNFVKVLERMKKAYQDKLIDREVFTNKTSTCRDKFYAGKVGIFPYWSGQWGLTLDKNIKLNFPKGEVVGVPAISGATYLNRLAPSLAITKACKNPEGVFKYIIEYANDGGKGTMLFVHGVEGVHWKKNGSEYVKLPTLTNPKALFEKSYIEPALALPTWENPFKMDGKISASRAINTAKQRQVMLLPLSQTYLKNGPDLMNLRGEIMAKVMLNQISIEEGLATYKKKAAALGVDKMLEEFNKAQ